MLDRNSTTSEFLHNLFLQHQLDLIPEIELSSNDLLIDLAKIGLGIAFVPDYCINHENKELFVLKTKEKMPPRQIVVSVNTTMPVSASTEEFFKSAPRSRQLVFRHLLYCMAFCHSTRVDRANHILSARISHLIAK